MAGSDDAYERGHIAGEIAARLQDHDRHFAAINGSIARFAAAQEQLVLQIQRLADAADADRVTAVKTAAALKEADEARREQADYRWSPLARLAAAAAVIATVTTIVELILRVTG